LLTAVTSCAKSRNRTGIEWITRTQAITSLSPRILDECVFMVTVNQILRSQRKDGCTQHDSRYRITKLVSPNNFRRLRNILASHQIFHNYNL